MAKEETGVSLRPSDMVEGGLLDDVVATVVEARFVMWDYDGKSDSGDVPLLKCTLATDDDHEVDQYWSAGSAKDWAPSADGKRLIPVGNAKGINLRSNLGVFLTSAINAGFPPEKLEDDISVLDGMVAHFIQVAAPKRSGLPVRAREDGREFEKTILTVDEISKLPWEKGKGGKSKTTSKSGKGKAASSSKDAGDGEVEAKAEEVIVLGLAEAEDAGLKKKELPGLVLKYAKDFSGRTKLLKVIYDEDFLTGEDRPWVYEDGVITAQE